MFERFTKSARQVVVESQYEARRLGHDYIGTEHLLLGLLAVEDGVAASVLQESGIDAATVQRDVVRLVGRGPGALGYGQDTYGGGDLDADALRILGIDLDAVRQAAEAAFGPGALERAENTLGRFGGRRFDGWWFGRRWSDRRSSGRRSVRRSRSRSCRSRPSTFVGDHVPFTPRAKKVLELSLREALALRHGAIGTEHILLGLIREGEGLATEVLVLHGLHLDDLRRRVLSALDDAA